MFEDEAGFGRISEPFVCWAPPQIRPNAPSQRVREYKTIYGAVSPEDGDYLFMELHGSNTDNMSTFLIELSKRFPDCIIILCCDNAGWHTSKELKTPENIVLFYIPPRTPEMNPIEQIWKEIRKRGFKNKNFSSINEVVYKFFEIVASMSKEVIMSITLRDWLAVIFGYSSISKYNELLSKRRNRVVGVTRILYAG